MRRLVFIVCFACVSACTQASSNALTKQAHALEVIQTLLNIPVKKYVTKDGYNALAAYHGWGDLYQSTYLSAQKGNTEDIKLYLLLGFIAQVKGQAASSEVFSSDLYHVFIEQPDGVLVALQQNPFLIASSCYYLGRFFGFESKNTEKKQPFIVAFSEKINRQLGNKKALKCLSQIKSPQKITY